MYDSNIAEKINNISIKNEKIVCLMISNFIFSTLRSCMIALYNLAPLTPNAMIHGIDIMLCNNSVDKEKMIPLLKPKVERKDEMV